MVTKPRGGAARWLGVDIGSRAIKLVQLERAPGGWRLIKMLVQELPEGAASGDTAARDGWLQSALKEFELQDRRLSVAAADVAIRRVQVPLMPANELPEAVKWQVKDQVPFPIQEAVLDFDVTGDVWDKDIKKQDILVAAGHAPAIEALAGGCERAGARVGCVAPAASAAWQGLTALVPEAATGSVALLDIGTSHTDVLLAKDGQIRLMRTMTVGCAQLTDSLVGAVASERGEIVIDRVKAAALTRRYGALTDPGDGRTEEGIPLFHLASLMRPILENLLTELSRVVDFYKVQLEQGGIGRVYLCGAGAALPHLQAYLADGLGMTVEVFNPLIRLPDRLQALEAEQIAEQGPRLAVATGLAIAAGQGLNLLPRDAGRRAMRADAARWQQIALRGGQAAGGILAALLLIAAGARWHLFEQERRWQRLEPAHAQAVNVTLARARHESAIKAVEEFADRQPVWDGLMKELAGLVPEGMTLERVAVTTEERGPMRFHLTGQASASAESGAGLAGFVEALEQSVFFARVELAGSELRAGERELTAFDIDGVLE